MLSSLVSTLQAYSESEKQNLRYLDQNFNAIRKNTDEAQMDFLELAQSNGYPVLHSFVTTKDGYILDVHRIPGKKGEILSDSLKQVQVEKRKPLLFIHGLLGSS